MNEPDKLLDHDYDGIKEYDNPLPRWWVAIFWITIVVAPFYILFYHMGPGTSVEQEYNAGMMELYDRQAKELMNLGPITDETIVKLAADNGMMSGARALFQAKCSPCHGALGEGIIGPNLTDEFWIHGGHPTEIHRTIAEGVPARGMQSWKSQLRSVEVLALAGYVTTLKGTNPPNAKPPEGNRQQAGPSVGAAPAAAATSSAS